MPPWKNREYVKPVTVAELIEHLKQFPQDLFVIRQRYSDLGYLSLDEVSVVEAVERPGQEWLRRPFRSGGSEKACKYLQFEGN